MNFILKLVKRPSGKEGTDEPEENKQSQPKPANRKNFEKQLAINKVNVNSIYNKEEDYKPMGSPTKPNPGQDSSDKNTMKFKQMVEEDPIVNLEALRKLAWQGVPQHLRHTVWKILLKYMPLNKESRESTVARKREEYASFLQMYFVNMNVKELDDHERKTFEVIKKDVYRTQPDYPIFQQKLMQDMMIRLLWVWHVRHPASGYVQGINDLTTPFIATFIEEYLPNLNFDTFEVPPDFEKIFTEEVVLMLEADIYWCLCKILDGILDNYTFSQSGTQKTLNKIREITKKIDAELFSYLESKEVDFTYFSFRWIFCLLVREFPLKVGLRLFDTYISDEQGFSVLHIYVCAALLLKWSIKLKKMNFTDIMLFLQSMPTKDWSEKDIEIIIAEAYVFKTLYEDTHGHFNSSPLTHSHGMASIH
jgi:hypothetical protein